MKVWRKSSYSSVNGDCVEVAPSESIFVRDSKSRLAGVIGFSPDAWETFITCVEFPSATKSA
ncbi:DUF397 domain-containing protein [Streptomyces sp. SID14446]|uniref:DUF397 domain-containing protein n=1 Tax=Streptomyces sp. SID14446 TaxID=2706072 RepID=UPI0013BA5193|nr:DUF397 domain-containing protein [Streptomyces sp. SID14446]NEB32804.1 DUF397 domain-containing protein [Streptomyces sp. SID14446]